MIFLLIVILSVYVFEYINGFHDAANAIATVVSTKVMTPRVAVIMAASGIAASRAATTGRCRAVSAIRYWAVKLTAAASAASTQRPAAALRSHRPERSWPRARR